MPENISVVPVTASSCQPFLLEVMVFSPEAGFKFEVTIERSCKKPTDTEPAKAVFKLVFDLYKKKKNSDEFDKIVHVSYTGENDVQQKKIESTAANGVNPAQSKQLITEVHPTVKDAENIDDLPPNEAEKVKAKVKKAMSKTVDLAL